MAVTSEDRLRTARLRMIEQLLVRRGIEDRRVLDAMAQVERHRFLDASLHERAYGPYILPIGAGQTVPHPYTVAVMAEALQLRGRECVLEIGAGSGYQTAILSVLAREVWSLELLPELAGRARQHLREMGIENAQVRIAGGLGWRERAPFDAIHVSASAPEVPGHLLAQLGRRGRLVLPVGRGPHQRLLLLVKKDQDVTTTSLGACRFRPLLGPRAGREPAWTGRP